MGQEKISCHKKKAPKGAFFDGLNHPPPPVTRITNIIVQFQENVNIPVKKSFLAQDNIRYLR